jgi:hypothetical protein
MAREVRVFYLNCWPNTLKGVDSDHCNGDDPP